MSPATRDASAARRYRQSPLPSQPRRRAHPRAPPASGDTSPASMAPDRAATKNASTASASIPPAGGRRSTRLSAAMLRAGSTSPSVLHASQRAASAPSAATPQETCRLRALTSWRATAHGTANPRDRRQAVDRVRGESAFPARCSAGFAHTDALLEHSGIIPLTQGRRLNSRHARCGWTRIQQHPSALSRNPLGRGAETHDPCGGRSAVCRHGIGRCCVGVVG